MYINRLLCCCLLLILLHLPKHNTFAQAAIPFSTSNTVYEFLDQLSLKYEITWHPLIRPVTRIEIARALQGLIQQREKLSKMEFREVQFYWQEFGDENFKEDTLSFFKKKSKYLLPTIYYKEKNNSFNLDPIIGGSVGQNRNENIIERNIGATVWGSLEKKVDYLFSYTDISLDGMGVKNIPNFSTIKKYVNIGSSKIVDRQNYNELRVAIAYRFKNGSISAGQDRFSYGQGESTQIVLSQNAPAYPYLRIQYQPFKWMQFNYMHSWLQSNILDSSAMYSYGNTTYGGYHEQYHSKYYAMHSISITPKPGIDINIGESIIYTNQLKPGYLIPVMYFKSYDNTSNNQNILAGDNGQLFLGINFRRLIPRTQIYGQLYIDEIRLTKFFATDNRNQLGYQLGVNKSGWFGKDNVVIGMEYTRNRPFIYSNINPVLNYTNHNEQLGDWMGNNADRFQLFLQYKPIERMYAKISLEKIRKGGAGTIDDQYLKSPQPPFLFDLLFVQKSINFEIRYQWLHNIHLQLLGNFVTINNPNGGEAEKSSYIKTGIYMGLY